MDGTFPDHQSVLIDILKAQNKFVNEHVIEEVHKNRVYCKSIPFESIDPEIIRTLNKLRQMNVKIGLISNCAPEEVEAWDTCTLTHLFDDVVFSYKVKQIKPNPEIYLTACNNLNVLPQNSIFIGDGGSNELVGASNVGMRAFHATWLPSFISKEIVGFPKLTKPNEIIYYLEKSQ